MSDEIISNSVQIIIIRTDLQMSNQLLIKEITKASSLCANQGRLIYDSPLGEYFKKGIWYKDWVVHNEMKKILLRADNNNALTQVWTDIIREDSMHIATHMSFCEGFIPDQKTPTCLVIGPVDIEVIKKHVMKLEVY